MSVARMQHAAPFGNARPRPSSVCPPHAPDGACSCLCARCVPAPVDLSRGHGPAAPTELKVPILASVAPPGSVTFVGAGDISLCSHHNDTSTAKLLDTIPGTVFVTGDNVGSPGDSATYANCYNPTWGRHKTRTFPVPGDAEYATAGAAGYYGYFGAAAGDPTKGYYSYDLGAWHVLALDSRTPLAAGSAQALWAHAGLAATPS